MMGLRFDTTQADPPRLLCLGAHCDDIEIGCGGTILRLIDEQPALAVRWVVFSGNATRREEARHSAFEYLERVEDKEIRLHDFRESFFPYHGEAIKEEFERLRRAFEPTLVLTHCKADHHQDHRTIAELTWNTFRNHLILEYEIPKYEGDLGNPNLFVPLQRRLAERKVAALFRHFRSQQARQWFTNETFLGLMRLRGIGCNATSGLAEAFHCHKLVI